MKVAAFDIGANSILCLIAETLPSNQILPLFEHSATTRLGDYSKEKNDELTPGAIDRSLKVLRHYRQLCRDYQVEKTVIVATSALREAANSNYFCERVKAEMGVPVLILSPKQEAEFSYRGALSNKQDVAGPILVFDIGGGSTELILGDHANLTFSTSIPIGAIKLTKKFFKTNPPNKRELVQTQRFLNDVFAAIRFPFCGFQSLIGVGGTVTTLAAIRASAKNYVPEKIDGTFLDFLTIRRIFKMLFLLTLEERKKIVGLSPERADIIISGTALLLELMKWLNAGKIMVSDRCLRYGAILKLI